MGKHDVFCCNIEDDDNDEDGKQEVLEEEEEEEEEHGVALDEVEGKEEHRAVVECRMELGDHSLHLLLPST